MNDTELDEILDAWSVPTPRSALRESVRAGFAANLERPTPPGLWPRRIATFARRSLLAAALVGVGAFLFAVTQAFPQTLRVFSPPLKAPYTVDSELVRYMDDGSSKIAMYLTSFNDNGREVVLSRSLPGDPIGTVVQRIKEFLGQLTLPLGVNSEERERSAKARSEAAAALIQSGCIVGVVLGRETILNHQTVASRAQLFSGGRVTWWMARDLGCFPLRIDTEEQQPNGTFRLASRKQALRVTVNP